MTDVVQATMQSLQLNEELEAKLKKSEARVAELENELASLKARWDSSAKVGHEAEDLRREIEDLIGAYGEIDHDELQAVLDRVDARDSLAWLQSRDDAKMAQENRELRRKLEVKEEAFDHLAERVGSFTAMKDEASRAWTRITQLESHSYRLEEALKEEKGRSDFLQMVLGRVTMILSDEGRPPTGIGPVFDLSSEATVLMEECEKAYKKRYNIEYD